MEADIDYPPSLDLPAHKTEYDNESDVADGELDTQRSFSELESDDEFFNDEGLPLLEDCDDQDISNDKVDTIFEEIKDAINRRQSLSKNSSSGRSVVSDDGPQVRISDQYVSVPFGLQPRASYEHGKRSSDIMGGEWFRDVRFGPKVGQIGTK